MSYKTGIVPYLEGASDFYVYLQNRRLAVGLPQPPVLWVPGAHSQGVKQMSVMLTTNFHQVY